MIELSRTERLRQALQETLQPLELLITDESAQHHGHAGAADGRGHFFVDIVSAAFERKSLVQQHQMVYSVCAALLKTDIHALRLKTRVPSQSF